MPRIPFGFLAFVFKEGVILSEKSDVFQSYAQYVRILFNYCYKMSFQKVKVKNPKNNPQKHKCMLARCGKYYHLLCLSGLLDNQVPF